MRISVKQLYDEIMQQARVYEAKLPRGETVTDVYLTELSETPSGALKVELEMEVREYHKRPIVTPGEA